jgi:hypothetical protein
VDPLLRSLFVQVSVRRGANLVVTPITLSILLHLGGWDISGLRLIDSGLRLIERKVLLEPLVVGKPGLQYNGHDTGDGELILKHVGKLGFEGVVSKTIDAPYAPGNRGDCDGLSWQVFGPQSPDPVSEQCQLVTSRAMSPAASEATMARFSDWLISANKLIIAAALACLLTGSAHCGSP